MNTTFDYKYVDTSNNKQYETVIFENEISNAERAIIMGSLNDRSQFIPEQVGLENLCARFGGSYEDDDAWHEVVEISLTHQGPDGGETISEFAARFNGIVWVDPNVAQGRGEFLTITLVVRGQMSGPDYDFEEIRALITPDEAIFAHVDDGVTPHARELGADPSSWSEDSDG